MGRGKCLEGSERDHDALYLSMVLSGLRVLFEHGLTQSYWLLTPACRADSPGSVTPNRWGNRDSERVFDSEDGVRVEIFFSD